MIVDESMMIGSQKLLFTLGIPCRRPARPLTPADVSILDMAVSSSWNSQGVKQQLLLSSQKAGSLPRYVVSDNASIMRGGISQAGLAHQRDISHSLGMFLERNYKKEPDFMAYTRSMSQAEFKNNMKNTAYLLPPRQRTVARFINLSAWVQWSEKILSVYPTLS